MAKCNINSDSYLVRLDIKPKNALVAGLLKEQFNADKDLQVIEDNQGRFAVTANGSFERTDRILRILKDSIEEKGAELASDISTTFRPIFDQCDGCD